MRNNGTFEYSHRIVTNAAWFLADTVYLVVLLHCGHNYFLIIIVRTVDVHW
jgi:hypothetical protein